MNPTVHQVMVDFEQSLGFSIYHTWWPSGSDPFYLFNTPAVHARISYYGINFTPDLMIDGTGAGDGGPNPGSYGSMASYINNRLAIPAPLTLDVAGLIQGGSPNGTINATVDLNVETPQAGSNYRLFVALVEEHIHLPSPNGEQDHYYVFRRFANEQNSGEVIDLSAAGAQHFDYTFDFVDPYQIDKMMVTAWVQNASTHEVIQTGKGHMLVPYYVTAAYDGLNAVIAAANEVVNFAGHLDNGGANNDVYDISVSGVPASWAYSYTTPAGTFSGPSTLPLNSGATAPITLELDSQGNAGPATVIFNVVSQNDPSNATSLQFQKMNGMQVLLVDDDGGGNRETFVEPSLAAAGVTWGTWHLTDGALTVTDLQNAASAVFWDCGAYNPSVTPNDRAALGAFMDGGGNVFLNGTDVSYDIANPASPNHTAASQQWFEDYMHATHLTNISFSWLLEGTAGDPIGDGLPSVALTSTGDNGQFTPDGVEPGPGAEIAFTYTGVIAQGEAMIRWEGAHKTVFMGVGIEGVTNESDRDLIVQRILDWFGSSTGVADAQGAAPLLRLAQNSPNPFRPATSIAYELLAPGQVTLRVYDVSGRMVRNLVDRYQAAMPYAVVWDGTDDAGHAVASGVYFYRLETPGATQTRRMVLSR